MRIYISGPMTGLPDLNKPAFTEAGAKLAALGHVTVNPHDNGLPDAASWEEHLRADIKLLMDCDAVALLPDWEKSRGANLERHVALQVAIPVRLIEEYLP